MSLSLAEALESVDLQPGQVYYESVRGLDVEVRVTPKKVEVEDDAPSPELLNQVMLDPWCELPRGPFQVVVGQYGPISKPDPPIIPEDWRAEDES